MRLPIYNNIVEIPKSSVRGTKSARAFKKFVKIYMLILKCVVGFVMTALSLIILLGSLTAGSLALLILSVAVLAPVGGTMLVLAYQDYENGSWKNY